MATILDGKKIADMRLGILKEDIEDSGLFPRLATVIAGADPASQMYIRMKHRACEQVGIGSVGRELAGDATTEQVLQAVTQLNSDPDINGILIQLPLPKQVDTERVIAAGTSEKRCGWIPPVQPRTSLFRKTTVCSLHTTRDHDTACGI